MKAQQSQHAWLSARPFRVALLVVALVGGAVACGGPSEGGDADPTASSNGGAALDGAKDAGTADNTGNTGTTDNTGTTPDAGSPGTPVADAGTPPPGSGSTCTSDTWGSYAQTFFVNSCAGCHSWASSYSTVKSDASTIKSRVSSGSMPKGVTLSSSEKARIIDWLDCGAPQ